MTTNIDSMQYMNRTVAEYLPPARPRRPPASSAVVLDHRELNRWQSNAADAIGKRRRVSTHRMNWLNQPMMKSFLYVSSNKGTCRRDE